MAVIREPPHVAQPDGTAQARQDELELVAPIVGPGPGPEVRQRIGQRSRAAAAFCKITVVSFNESEQHTFKQNSFSHPALLYTMLVNIAAFNPHGRLKNVVQEPIRTTLYHVSLSIPTP